MSDPRDYILQHVEYGLVQLAPDGLIVHFNRRAGEILGLSAGDVGRSIDSAGTWFPDKCWQSRVSRLDAMVRRGETETHFLASTVVRDDGIVLVLERDMPQIEDDFRFFIMDNMSEGVVLVDTNGAVLYMNNSAKQLLGIGLHAGQAAYWKMDSFGEFQPSDFWRNQAYKKEVLFRREGRESRFLSSVYPKGDRTILCFEAERAGNVRYLPQDTLATVDLNTMAGIGPELRKEAMILANSDLSFMVTGESGTGKEVMARAVHFSSQRSKGPFIVIDCTTLPEQLIESELFGYEPGSFTGAKSDGRAGKFELADGGTIVLDEVADLPPALQPKLLRVLNDRMVSRLGSRMPKAVDVRVIACTNRDLGELVEKKEFRLDLYHRLKGATLSLPPLRERMRHFDELLLIFMKKYGHRKAFQVAPEAMRMLYDYQWPGNIRELEKTAHYLTVRAADGRIAVEHLPKEIVYGEMDTRAGSLRDVLQAHERLLVNNALAANGHNIAMTAGQLGLSDWGLRKKMKVLGIELPLVAPRRIPKHMGRGNKARIEIVRVEPTAVAPGGAVTVALKVTNLGRNPWLDLATEADMSPGKYAVQVDWVRPGTLQVFQTSVQTIYDPEWRVKVDYMFFTKPVDPAETGSITATMSAPQERGTYACLLSIAHMGIGTFVDVPRPTAEYGYNNFPKFMVEVK